MANTKNQPQNQNKKENSTKPQTQKNQNQKKKQPKKGKNAKDQQKEKKMDMGSYSKLSNCFIIVGPEKFKYSAGDDTNLGIAATTLARNGYVVTQPDTTFDKIYTDIGFFLNFF